MATPAAPRPETNNLADPFVYDYDTLRTVGLVLAIVMFVLGIVIALSKKLRCKKSDPSLSDPRAAGKTLKDGLFAGANTSKGSAGGTRGRAVSVVALQIVESFLPAAPAGSV